MQHDRLGERRVHPVDCPGVAPVEAALRNILDHVRLYATDEVCDAKRAGQVCRVRK
jgi:hypothetical protein